MSHQAVLDPPLAPADVAGSARTFAVAAVGLAILSAFLAGWVPLGFSIVTVFLFAGPHNWIRRH